MKFLNQIIRRNTIITMALLISVVLISCEKSTRKPVDSLSRADIENMKADHIIPLKEAVKMYDKYTKERIKILKDTLKKKYGDDFSDTRTVWFDIKTIKAYLKYLEENANEAEGLQFYFSVNPDNKDKESNHQTFFIAPTIKNVVNGDTIQSGYTLENGQRVFLYEAFKKSLERTETKTEKAAFFATLQDNGGLILNDMQGSPPGGNN